MSGVTSCRSIKSIVSVMLQSRRTVSSAEWRKLHKRPRTRLNDAPDWSYLDGRGLGPLTPSQKGRYIRDQELGKVVVKRIKELQEMKTLKLGS